MNINRLLLACAVLSASATVAWSQDTLQVERIEFDFDENGAFKDENPIFEQLDSLEESDIELDTPQEEEVNRRLVIETGTSTDIASVSIENSLKPRECTLTVFTISGIKVFSKSFHGNRFRYDLSQLPKGEYIVTLSIDGKKESRKYSRR